MTVTDLVRLLRWLPEEYAEATVFIGGGPHFPPARVMVVIPQQPGDTLTPRVELRAGLPYRADPDALRPCECDDDKPAA